MEKVLTGPGLEHRDLSLSPGRPPYHPEQFTVYSKSGARVLWICSRLVIALVGRADARGKAEGPGVRVPVGSFLNSAQLQLKHFSIFEKIYLSDMSGRDTFLFYWEGGDFCIYISFPSNMNF